MYLLILKSAVGPLLGDTVRSERFVVLKLKMIQILGTRGTIFYNDLQCLEIADDLPVLARTREEFTENSEKVRK